MLGELWLAQQLLRHGADPEGAAVIVLSRDLHVVWSNPEGTAMIEAARYLRQMVADRSR
jgi:hypothetical protein